ncbi:hypothetical protein [Chroococcidiopsis sp [FACHB-1243]]|nr:hypothetical protein [Chroococcidiopsis sp. [FACHB-1243]]
MQNYSQPGIYSGTANSSISEAVRDRVYISYLQALRSKILLQV